MVPYDMFRFKRLSLLLICLGTVHRGDCIDCYSCTSDESHCGEIPDGDQLIINGKVASGCPSCVKKFNFLGTIWSRVERRCGTSSETTDSCSDILGNGKCVCTTTFCNHGNNIHATRKNLQITIMCNFVFLLMNLFFQ